MATNSEIAISIKDLSKHFKVYYDKGTSLKEKILFQNRNRYEDRVVLNGISLDIPRGQAVGLIGHNGCGKSTLLKLMTRILYPDKGTVEVKGRVSSLLELGAGFHPDMSGRENIYTNASIFGLSKKEIDRRLNSIIAFSELEEFIDNPVRTYSSGMYMRLAFSVAINVDADVLLVDEILAVGDANFQAKCFAKLQDIKKKGTTIVIVSHSLGQIEQICDRSIWIHEGKIQLDGTPRDVHPAYMDMMGRMRQAQLEKEQVDQASVERDMSPEEVAAQVQNDANGVNEAAEQEEAPVENKRWGNGNARINKVTVLDGSGKESNVIAVGSPAAIRIDYEVKNTVEDAVFGIGIFRADGLNVYGTNTRIDEFDVYDVKKNGSLTIELPKLMLLPGTYYIDLAIESGLGLPVDYWKEACEINMYSSVGDVGTCRITHKWKFTDDSIKGD